MKYIACFVVLFLGCAVSAAARNTRTADCEVRISTYSVSPLLIEAYDEVRWYSTANRLSASV